MAEPGRSLHRGGGGDEGDIREAIVMDDTAGRLRLSVEPGAEAGGTGCAACAARRLCGEPDRKRFEAIVERPAGGSESRPGEVVRLLYKPPSPARGAIAMFLPPLAGLFAGGAAAGHWLGDGAIFLAGPLAGLAAGFAVAAAAARWLPSLRPEIRLIPPGDDDDPDA